MVTHTYTSSYLVKHVIECESQMQDTWTQLAILSAVLYLFPLKRDPIVELVSNFPSEDYAAFYLFVRASVKVCSHIHMTENDISFLQHTSSIHFWPLVYTACPWLGCKVRDQLHTTFIWKHYIYIYTYQYIHICNTYMCGKLLCSVFRRCPAGNAGLVARKIVLH